VTRRERDRSGEDERLDEAADDEHEEGVADDGEHEEGVADDEHEEGVEVEAVVVGEEARTVRLSADATYGDVVRAVGLRTGEATALVDGTPVPEDRPVDVDVERVRVLRLIRGG
jgi:sulfur carrier protein